MTDRTGQLSAADASCLVGNVKSQYARALDNLRALVREPNVERN